MFFVFISGFFGILYGVKYGVIGFTTRIFIQWWLKNISNFTFIHSVYTCMNGTFLRGVRSTFLWASREEIYIQLFYDLPEKSNVANFVGLIAYMQTHILYIPSYILHLSSVASVGIIIILIIDMILPILAKDFFVIIFIKRNINSFWK